MHSKALAFLIFLLERGRLRRDVLLVWGENEEGGAAHLCFLYTVSGIMDVDLEVTDSSLCVYF